MTRRPPRSAEFVSREIRDMTGRLGSRPGRERRAQAPARAGQRHPGSTRHATGSRPTSAPRSTTSRSARASTRPWRSGWCRWRATSSRRARSPKDAIGLTQLRLATARFYVPGVTATRLQERRPEPADRVPVPEGPARAVRRQRAARAAGLQPRPDHRHQDSGAGRRPGQRLRSEGPAGRPAERQCTGQPELTGREALVSTTAGAFCRPSVVWSTASARSAGRQHQHGAQLVQHGHRHRHAEQERGDPQRHLQQRQRAAARRRRSVRR